MGKPTQPLSLTGSFPGLVRIRVRSVHICLVSKGDVSRGGGWGEGGGGSKPHDACWPQLWLSSSDITSFSCIHTIPYVHTTMKYATISYHCHIRLMKNDYNSLFLRYAEGLIYFGAMPIIGKLQGISA
jgi:hypothetical protein